jgi:flagellar protein FliO/FliZ
MTKFITPSRATSRVALPALGMATIGLALLADACPAQAFTPASKHGGEALPLNLSTTSTGSHTSSGGASIVRTIVGLLIVIAVIWGLTWILKQVKTGRETRSAGSGLTSLATLALGSGRTLHLVRAGRDYLLVGSAEHGVAPIHRYTEEQAREAGLLDLPEPPSGGSAGDGTGRAGRPRIRPMQIPGQVRPDWNPTLPSTVSDALERVREWTVRK